MLIIILKILAFAVAAIIISLLFIGIVCSYQYLTWFYCHSCKNCGNTMEYKGMREEDHESCCLFYCPKCGKWELIPYEDFLSGKDR